MKIRTILILGTLAIACGAISLWMGVQSYSWLPPQASAESVLVDRLFSVLVAIGTFIFLGVSGTLTYSALFQQAGKYEVGDGPPIEGNVTLEIVWTAIPFVLAVAIAAYSYHIYDKMSLVSSMERVQMGAATAQAATIDGDRPILAEEESETIEVRARQWVWEFRYPKSGITSTELHLPNNRRVRLLMTSEDVIHGFYIPAFRVKQDVIPGEAIEFQFTPIREGRYRLRDSQYSGTYFAAMQADVVVESPSAYEKWRSQAAVSPLVEAYNQAYDEYHNARNIISAGWETVEPAQPPLVNYSRKEDSNK
ncbi:MAG: cytochrome c oxidase subunit II [Cyanobacteriota bacterium]|nr:cytochrome c oxidase subunit II [Cyanobacteriota bacterium]